MIENPTLEQLRGGGLSLGVVLRYARTPDIARAMRACGLDWLFLDLEHSAMSLDTASAISVAALDVGITPCVRVPAMDFALAARALDTGALGVLMPHVETVEETRAIAAAFRYPPSGHRSSTSTLPHFDFKVPSLQEACRQLDAATLVAVILETPKSIENVDAIAAVPGVDVLMIGASDLTLEMGMHGQFGHPRVVSMLERVAQAGRRHGKFVGIGGVGDDADVARCYAMGMQMLLAGTDMSFLMSAASGRADALRKLLQPDSIGNRRLTD
jgi:2-keto-3-deoxy-L-rhamnonate aldolase RhmA